MDFGNIDLYLWQAACSCADWGAQHYSDDLYEDTDPGIFCEEITQLMLRYLTRRCPGTGRNFTKAELYESMVWRRIWPPSRRESIPLGAVSSWDCDIFSIGWFELGIHADSRDVVTGIALAVPAVDYDNCYIKMPRRWFRVSAEDFLDCLQEVVRLEDRIMEACHTVLKILPSRVRILQHNRIIEEIRNIESKNKECPDQEECN